VGGGMGGGALALAVKGTRKSMGSIDDFIFRIGFGGSLDSCFSVAPLMCIAEAPPRAGRLPSTLGAVTGPALLYHEDG
jgi:hypothetical protein